MTEAVAPAVLHGRPMDEAQLIAWVVRSAPGQHLTYWDGYLARDTWSLGSRLGERDRRRLARLGRLVLSLAEEGFLHLVQQRLAAYRYRYIAIARSPERDRAGRRPEPVAHPLPQDPTLNRSIA
jgi:hypothetical protein